MRTKPVLFLIVSLILVSAVPAFTSVKYIKVASFKDISQSRVFFISLKEAVSTDQLEENLWEIVSYYMDRYGQAPQMWIYFFDDKNFAPKQFPIEGESIGHLIARYFYATDTREKDLKIFSKEDVEELKKSGKIESPLWHGQ